MKHTKCYIPEYPRPQFVRADWQNLNGSWKFGFGEEVNKEDALSGKLPRNITVPFSYESKLSGICDTAPHSAVWYSRIIRGKAGKRTILNFEGADYVTSVYVNGKIAGSHSGAYSRFSFDITDFLNTGDNILSVLCKDSNHPVLVRGKQRWKDENFGCWYVQTTGIYKTVWLEYVNETYLTALKITPDISDNTVKFDLSVSCPSCDADVRIDVSYDGKQVCRAGISASEKENSVSVRLDTAALTYQVEKWSVDNPALYDVKIEVIKAGKVTDCVGSYFGLRDYRAENGKLLLNDVPFYARLLLDQGYWAESGLTPPSEEALVKDINLCKAMGFNGVRKHQKVEDERFMYYADILGFTVWCELPSNHYFCDDAVCDITTQWLNIVRQNYNHPSVVTWVIFNESWGVRGIFSNEAQQNLAAGLYYVTKSIDTMRPVISNDGWVHCKSDILTLHHYEQSGEKLYEMYSTREKLTEGSAGNSQFLPYARGYKYEGQPIVFSEFGGTAYSGDCENKAWGYGNGVSDDNEFSERFASLIKAVEKMDISGYCYTQITDVEQEVNGLLKADRTPKLPVEKIAKLNGK